MSRVITEGGVFTRRHHVELRRRMLHDALLSCCTSALPGLLTLGVDVEKIYEGESHTFDLAIFDLEDLRWWVGRTLATVEDLEFEILLPTHALRRTQYLTDDGAQIAKDAPTDCRELVASTVIEAVPEVVTFVSNPLPEWYERVGEFEGQLAVLESFRGPSNTTLLRVNGQLPRARGALIGSCEPMSESAGLIRVAGASEHWSNELATLEYRGDTVGVSGQVVGEDVLIRLEPRLVAPNADVSLTLWRLGDRHLEIREGIDV